MKTLTFWFDPISPYAYLAFEKLPETLAELPIEVVYRPVLFAGMLKHFGQLGPAEIPPKKVWTFRQIAWLAHRHGVPLDFPAAHPFNPLPLLRLGLAHGRDGACSREVAGALFAHVWRGGADAADPARISGLAQALAKTATEVSRDPNGDAVKAELRHNGDTAITRGIFGVPTFEMGEESFWGFDALPIVREALTAPTWFCASDSPWTLAAKLPTGVARSR